MFKHIRQHLEFIIANDPAARSKLEICLCYPGLHAIWWHRLAHFLWNLSLKLPARLVAYLSRFLTGIEIHPAAKIGQRVFIDHGMGVVIGETAIIGDEVVIFHGVTLGGVSSSRGHKRHPTLQAGAVIGSGAQLLGDITIGEGARVGSNAVVLGDVAPGATVVGVPAREVRRATPVDELPLHRPELPPSCGNSPDPVGATMAELISDMEQLRQRLAALEAEREQRNRYSG